MYLLVCVLDNPSHLADLLEEWSEAGVQGITVLDSIGVQRVRERGGHVGHLFAGFARLLPTDQYNHNTLFAIVPDMDVVHRAAAATESLVGDLRRPHTGILFALPVAAAWGLPKHYGNTPA